MKFTGAFLLCHKALGLPSTKILALFAFNIDITVWQTKIKS
jgi:hypothetical protein